MIYQTKTEAYARALDKEDKDIRKLLEEYPGKLGEYKQFLKTKVTRIMAKNPSEAVKMVQAYHSEARSYFAQQEISRSLSASYSSRSNTDGCKARGFTIIDDLESRAMQDKKENDSYKVRKQEF